MPSFHFVPIPYHAPPFSQERLKEGVLGFRVGLLLSIPLCMWGILFLIGLHRVAASEKQNLQAVDLTRQVVFELTYANEQVIWHGDPASPTASASLKWGASPIATDLWVRAVGKDPQSPGRHYLREARIAEVDGTRQVYAFTSKREKNIGTINERNLLSPNAFYQSNRPLLPSWPIDASVLAYDSKENALYYEVHLPGPKMVEWLDHLPLKIHGRNNQLTTGQFSLETRASARSKQAEQPATATLLFRQGGQSISLATVTLPSVFSHANIQLGSFDNSRGTYHREAIYRPGAQEDHVGKPSVTFTMEGNFTPSVQVNTAGLVIDEVSKPASVPKEESIEIHIDGNFSDWRNIVGIDDPRGDLVPYLEYIPAVDLLEFKVSHDDNHLYLYARVAGKVGQSHPQGGRSYFYAYLDVDQNTKTGFLPSRDDDCYFGVDLGDDCEVQFEFVNNTLRKTFYGFCGIGGNENILKGEVLIGKSQYGRYDEAGRERANYKSEYTYRNGVTEITEDLKFGTSDTIRLAISPDGHEVEVATTFSGFLKNPAGQPTVQLGQTIDLAVGMECDSKRYPDKSQWAADNTRTIHGYHLANPKQRKTSK